MDSVREWCALHAYRYRFIDDALFERVPADILSKTAASRVVATDIGRLFLIRSALAEGFDRVLWLDADTLVLNPQRFILPDAGFAVGREHWIQADGARWRCYRKVHNAFLLAVAGNPVLEFYLYTALNIVRAHSGRHMVPQLVGPKLLTALHNISAFTVCESADVMSPPVLADVIAGGGAALSLWRERADPAAVNLCQSSVRDGTVDDALMAGAVVKLLGDPQPAL